MSKSIVQTNLTLRLQAVCGIIAPVMFTTVLVTLGLLRPGYSHISQAGSELGEVGAPNAIIMDINFIVFGILIIVFAFGLHQGIGGGRGSKIGPSLLAVFGAVAGVGNGLFPCDPGCNFVTLTGTMHNVLGLTGFSALIGAALVLPRRLKIDGLWQGYRSYSLVSGLLMVLFLVAFMVFTGFLPSYRGAIQRLLVADFLLWIGVMAVRLFQVASQATLQAYSQVALRS